MLGDSRDIVITVPRECWDAFTATGGATGAEWWVGAEPPCRAGDRLYFVGRQRLRGFGVVRTVTAAAGGGWVIGWDGPLTPATLGRAVPGFNGWRRRWWSRAAERAFADWQSCGPADADGMIGGTR